MTTERVTRHRMTDLQKAEVIMMLKSNFGETKQLPKSCKELAEEWTSILGFKVNHNSVAKLSRDLGIRTVVTFPNRVKNGERIEKLEEEVNRCADDCYDLKVKSFSHSGRIKAIEEYLKKTGHTIPPYQHELTD